QFHPATLSPASVRSGVRMVGAGSAGDSRRIANTEGSFASVRSGARMVVAEFAGDSRKYANTGGSVADVRAGFRKRDAGPGDRIGDRAVFGSVRRVARGHLSAFRRF